MGDWQPIETAPKDGTFIDLWMVGESLPGGRMTDCHWMRGNKYHPEGGWYSYELNYGDGDWFDDTYQPTHWMPLPAPPEPSK